MIITLDTNTLTDESLKRGISLLSRLLSASSHQSEPEMHRDGEDASVPDQTKYGPSLQLAVLRILAESPTGSMTSHEVAKQLGMSHGTYAAKIRGTGRAAEQAQDILYTRGWTFQDGGRVRVYTISEKGREVAAKLK